MFLIEERPSAPSFVLRLLAQNMSHAESNAFRAIKKVDQPF